MSCFSIVQRLDDMASGALRAILAAQPNTQAKVVCAWKIAAGPAFAQAAVATWASSGGGTLYVRAKSDAWRKELSHARPILVERIAQLLGPGVVREIKFT